MPMYKAYEGTYYGNNYTNTSTFLEIYPDVDTFLKDYHAVELPVTISDDNLRILYYVLVGRRGNDNIMSSVRGQFKYRLFTLIWEYGPYWEKQLEVQTTLRNLSTDEILNGSKQIYNQATNPSTPITADSEGHTGSQSRGELNYVNNQNVSLNSRGKVDGLSIFANVLKSDVSNDFFRKFDTLFNAFPQLPLFYCVEMSDQNPSQNTSKSQ